MYAALVLLVITLIVNVIGQLIISMTGDTGGSDWNRPLPLSVTSEVPEK